jgi:hypothetical protein
MALRVAVANGNWSNPSIWNGGVLPTTGDIVASNGFTITIDQNINVDSITNTAQAVVGAVPIMTSNTTPSGIASTNVGTAWYAFDAAGFNSDWIVDVVSPGTWLAYEFTSPIAIDQYSFAGYSNQNNWTFEAWNGSTWIVLHTITGASVTSYTSPLLGNSTAYIKYRFVLNDSGYRRIYGVQMYQYLGTTASVAGGTFNLNSGVTVTLTGTNSINQGAVTVLTCNVTTGNTSTLIGNNFNRANVAQPLIVLAGSGTFNVSGSIPSGGGSSLAGIEITGVNSTLNFTGTINSGSGAGAHGINTNVVCTINVVGSTTGGFSSNLATGVRFNSAGIFTLVGTATGGAYGNNHGVYLNNTTATITGDVYGGNSYGESPGVQADNNSNITITGTMYGRLSSAFRSSSNIYLNHYGTINCTGLSGITGSQSNVALSSTGTGAINILTGPFISSPTGIQPLYVSRMHYRRTIGSYYEFRDNSTGGVLPPSAPAPATRLVSPDTVVDAPSPANVRFGTTYALGSQTGTMRVPIAGAVAYGVEVDNTIGTALLSAAQVWNYLRNDISVTGSIGDRLKNCATVESTGSQIASFKSS